MSSYVQHKKHRNKQLIQLISCQLNVGGWQKEKALTHAHTFIAYYTTDFTQARTVIAYYPPLAVQSGNMTINYTCSAVLNRRHNTSAHKKNQC